MANVGELCKQFVALREQRRGLDAESKEIKAQMDVLEEQILEIWADQGIDGMKVSDTSLYIGTRFYPKIPEGLDKDAALDSLDAAGYGDLVKRDFCKVSGWLAGLPRGEDNMPIVPDGVNLEASCVVSLQGRKSS